jgi:hypothetical protein
MRKNIMQILTLGIIMAFSIQQSYGQIAQSRSDIIKENGYSYESGTADDGTKYIYYDKEFTSEQSGKYDQRKVIYFITLDDGTELCSFWKILEPSSETNPWVYYFKKNMVEVDYMKWKDYESGVLYKLEVEDKICIVTAWYDFKKQ